MLLVRKLGHLMQILMLPVRLLKCLIHLFSILYICLSIRQHDEVFFYKQADLEDCGPTCLG
ncbi:hypothetical protein D3C87_648670 [compost metagenome]